LLLQRQAVAERLEAGLKALEEVASSNRQTADAIRKLQDVVVVSETYREIANQRLLKSISDLIDQKF
jgi:uncharacterized protein YigA (DUF484 family)